MTYRSSNLEEQGRLFGFQQKKDVHSELVHIASAWQALKKPVIPTELRHKKAMYSQRHTNVRSGGGWWQILSQNRTCLPAKQDPSMRSAKDFRIVPVATCRLLPFKPRVNTTGQTRVHTTDWLSSRHVFRRTLLLESFTHETFERADFDLFTHKNRRNPWKTFLTWRWANRRLSEHGVTCSRQIVMFVMVKSKTKKGAIIEINRRHNFDSEFLKLYRTLSFLTCCSISLTDDHYGDDYQ